ncbi:MAG TPA: IPT/TIG domain-containing protein, partial [Actinomycetota bacterium]|nr:IPT/TIG domain-containing protein [Actinomycetota bacterium]
KLTATVPAGATDGPIAVTNADGTATSAASFDVTASPVPTITSFNPTSGPPGSSVDITGTGFFGASAVQFNNTNATFTVDSDTHITATVPAGATTGPIKVTTPGGTATSATNFTVTAGGFAITSFNPTSGVIGTSVVITGVGFTDVNQVRFNGTSATFTVDSDTQITAIVPGGATTGPISVTKPGNNTATSSTNFTVTPSPVPTLSSFNPTSGTVGTSVSIIGTGFIGASAVRFNGTSATFTVNSNTQITATVPSGATTGPIAVTTPGGTATSTMSFTVTGPAIHPRTITLDLRRHLVARGLVTVDDGFGDCASNVPVKIQRLRDGRWRTVETTQTTRDGAYREQIPDRRGTYRAVATRLELNGGADVCARDRSPRERHTH